MNLSIFDNPELTKKQFEVYYNNHPELKDLGKLLRHILDWQLATYETLKNNNLKSWEENINLIYYLFEINEKHGSGSIKKIVNDLSKLDEKSLKQKIQEFISNFCNKKSESIFNEERFIFLVFLKPFYYFKGKSMSYDKITWLKPYCPVCGGHPSIAFIYDTEDIKGGLFLKCLLCDSVWIYYRIFCLNCQNNNPNLFDVYILENFKNTQLMVCHQCNHYLKIFDIRNENYVIIDLRDWFTITFDLWAIEKGFVKHENNILGL